MTARSQVYTSNAYMVQGTWNTLDDLNTMIDVGRDEELINLLRNHQTGVGKRKVDQVILTHSHYDHVGMLAAVRDAFKPTIFAFSESLNGVDQVLKDGQMLHIADRKFEVMHAPGHSQDSICLYCAEERTLFTGDTPIRITAPGDSYDQNFISFMVRLMKKNVHVIYPGHGAPITRNCNEIIQNSLAILMKGF